MATIIGGIAASHTPTIGFAYDRDKRGDPVWAPIFEAFDPVRRWVDERQPDVLLFIYNDHVTSFFFDHYSAFTLGVGPHWAVADEGAGARDLPGVQGHPEFAAHLGRSLMADEFDMSFFQDRALDHGCFSPLSMLCASDAAGRGTVKAAYRQFELFADQRTAVTALFFPTLAIVGGQGTLSQFAWQHADCRDRQYAGLLALAATGTGVGMHRRKQHGVAVGARVVLRFQRDRLVDHRADAVADIAAQAKEVQAGFMVDQRRQPHA